MEKVQYDQRYVSLLEVHRLGSYSASGAVLGLTPSAVAHQIHSIERELNVSLFVKREQKLISTQECDAIVEYVKRIQSLCKRMELEIDLLHHSQKQLTVGVTSSAENFALSKVFTKYVESRSSMKITIRVGTSQELRRMLKDYSIDLAVVEGNYTGNSLNSIILDTDHLTVAVPPDSVYAKAGLITLKELKQESLILKPKGSGTRDLLEASLKSRGVSLQDLHVMMEADSVSTIKKLVANHYGISVLSNKACMKDVDSGKICTVPLAGINMIRKIQLLYRKDFHQDALLKEIQTVYTETVREMGADLPQDTE